MPEQMSTSLQHPWLGVPREARTAREQNFPLSTASPQQLRQLLPYLATIAVMPDSDSILGNSSLSVEIQQWKVNTHQCKVLGLGKNNPEYKYRMGGNWWGDSIAKKDLGALMDHTLNRFNVMQL